MTASERIKKIQYDIRVNGRQRYVYAKHINDFEEATAQYLDEDKERVNGILHTIANDLWNNVTDIEKINKLHAMIDETLTGSDK